MHRGKVKERKDQGGGGWDCEGEEGCWRRGWEGGGLGVIIQVVVVCLSYVEMVFDGGGRKGN